MKKPALTLFVVALSAFGQYKLESAGAPPADLTPAVRDALQKDGARIAGPDGSAFAEIWLRAELPKAPNGETNASFTDIAHGTLMGVIRFSGKGADRRGQDIAPGVYTLRLSFFPVDGAHQGVATFRDFLLMTPAAEDKDLAATPNYKQLVEMSKKASKTTHPAILGAWRAESAGKASLRQDGEDWILESSVGGQPIAIIVAGAFAG